MKSVGPQNRVRRTFAGIHFKECVMSINKDQVKGRVDEVKGGIKQAIGKIIDNDSLEAKGKIEKSIGSARAKYGDIEENLNKPSK